MFEKDEDGRAVSPVIGVILMVAITVILAAVIAAFVLDLGQSQSAPVNAGVSFEESGDEVKITLTDSGNAEGVNIRADGAGSDDWVDAAGTGTQANPEDYNLATVGQSVTIDTSSSPFDTATDLVIVAKSDSGEESVINDYSL